MQVKLNPMELPTELPDCLSTIRKMQLDDRALMDKAARAFVSYVQSYSKHECNVLLRVKGWYMSLHIERHAQVIHLSSCPWHDLRCLLCPLQTWTLVDWPPASDCSLCLKCPN